MRVFVMLILVMVFSSCVRNKSGVAIQNMPIVGAKVFEVTEVIQATNYSYLKVKENSNERWVAVTKQDVNVGDVFYYDEAMQMTNFQSKDLDRTFDEIYFVNQISKTPMAQNPAMGGGTPAMGGGGMPNMGGGGMPAHSGKVETPKISTITLEKAKGELTVADVFENRAKYAENEFEIRGIVVKVNMEVMGRNWIHIQDGTGKEGEFDLTITTQDAAEKGDEVVFKGKVTLNKDYGSGYSYDVIMEDGVLVDKKVATAQL